MSLLEVTDVAKSYGPVVALRSADLVVEPGEMHALMGANGAGKSTLVKILTGVIRRDAGDDRRRRRAGHDRLARARPPRRPRPRLPGPGAAAGPHRRAEPAPHAAPTPRACGAARPRWSLDGRPHRAGQRPAAARRCGCSTSRAPSPTTRSCCCSTRSPPRCRPTSPSRSSTIMRDWREPRPLGAVHLPPPRRGDGAVRPGDRPARRPSTSARSCRRRARRTQIVELMLGPSAADARAAGDRGRRRRGRDARPAGEPGAVLEVRGLAVGGQPGGRLFEVRAGRDRRRRRARGPGPGRALRLPRRPAQAAGGEIVVDGKHAEGRATPTTRSAPASCSCPPTG